MDAASLIIAINLSPFMNRPCEVAQRHSSRMSSTDTESTRVRLLQPPHLLMNVDVQCRVVFARSFRLPAASLQHDSIALPDVARASPRHLRHLRRTSQQIDELIERGARQMQTLGLRLERGPHGNALSDRGTRSAGNSSSSARCSVRCSVRCSFSVDLHHTVVGCRFVAVHVSHRVRRG